MTLPFPKAEEKVEKPKSALDRLRICPTCGNPTRISFNSTGGTAYCGPCKQEWPIVGPPNPINMVPLPGRGLSKQTIISPDMADIDALPPPDEGEI
jgi:hypothetical protein